MPAKRRDGVKTRPLADWYASDLSGADQSIPACAGHYQVFGLYNNANDGSVLKVYAVNAWVNVATLMHFNLVIGQPGILVTTTWGSIDPLAPTLWGQPITVGLTVQIGRNAGGVTIPAATTVFYAPGWPIAIVRPGWSFLLHPNDLGTVNNASIWWLPATA